ncbi:MAG: DUF1841 family protein [Silvanigrellaceae bacterium]|nr:DUF1841 family protein [Silvanigrellaceae bacterium]
MFFGENVEETRQPFFQSWRKQSQGLPLTALEQQLVAVIVSHPEYQEVLRSDDNLTRTYSAEMGETNPFLHMGLHLAVREQVQTNRPLGISALSQQLIEKYGDQHAAEHVMMECLAECLWQAQRTHMPPNEQKYLEYLTYLA